MRICCSDSPNLTTREYSTPTPPAPQVAVRIVELLSAEARPEDAAPMAAYMRNQFPFLGVRAGARRAATKAVIRELKAANDRRVRWDVVDALMAQPWRECHLVACDYVVACHLEIDDLPHLKHLVCTNSWWDSVDSVVKAIGAMIHREGQARTIMEAWATDANVWVCRTAIIHQLGLKAATDTALLEDIVALTADPRHPHAQNFFIRKAIGWALREYAKTDPDWVRMCVSRHPELSPLSVREALKGNPTR